MKKLLVLFVTSLLTFGYSSAQYCGNSGPAVCTPSTTINQPGLSPQSGNLPALINGDNTATTIQFENFNTLVFAGQTITMQSLTLDTITNLPAGLCWATNKTDNTFGNQETGCILVSGTPCDSTGQYKLHIFVTANIGFAFPTNADVAGLHYYVRLVNNGETAPPVDTTQTEAHRFKPYNVVAVCQELPLVVALDTPQTACNGSTITLTPTLSGGAGTYTYLWTSTGDTLFCPTCMSTNVTITQNDTFTLTVIDGSNDTAIATNTYTSVGGGNDFNVIATSPTTICQGDSVSFSAASIPGYTYRWLHNGTHVSGANDSVFTAHNIINSARYSCVITVAAFGCRVNSNSILVTVNPTPSVAFSLPISNFCSNGSPLTLNQGVPSGGVYTIDHIITSTAFNPAIETPGAHSITYVYTDSAGCSDSVSNGVSVNVCSGIDAVKLQNSISVYPNPAGDILNIQSDFFAGNNIVPVVYDLSGKAINVSFIRQANQISFDTQTLAAGSYLIKLGVNGQVVIKSFVKE